MKEYKYRHELKFKISESAAEVLKQKLSLIMTTDNNGYFTLDKAYAGTQIIELKSEGYFEFEKNITDDERKVFFNMSAPAILFPYIRAYISALTSLSGINPVILPTLNLSKR